MSIRNFNRNNNNIHEITQKTSVHLGRFGLLNPDGSVARGGFKDLDDADLQRLFEKHHILHQENFSDEIYVHNSVKLVGDSIGRGVSGIAFRCLFKGGEYVIKIPITMWKDRLLYKDGRDFLIRNLNNDNKDRYNQLRRRSDRSFRDECLFNEMAIDSKLHRTIRDKQPGSRLPRTNYRGYLNLKNELNLIKSHEGYDHIHKIVGFVPGLPIIFSEPCTGSLNSIIKSGSNKNIFNIDTITKKLSSEWLELAKQIGSAVQYLKEVANLVHMDIKPDNILFVEQVNESMQSIFNWKLSDFGICKAMNDDNTYTTKFIGGSPKYLPKFAKQTEINGGLFDAYECSLYSYMLTMLVSIKFDLPNGGYLFSRGLHLRASHPSDADIIDYINADPDILGLLNEALEYGTDGFEILSSDRDSVFDMLSKMFFSNMSDKPIYFDNLMLEIKNELNTRSLIHSRSTLMNPQIQEISNSRYGSFSPSIGYRDLIRPLNNDEEEMVRTTRRRI
jgi:hypothetical protein